MNQEITIEELQRSEKSQANNFLIQVYKEDRLWASKLLEAYYDMFKGNEHRLFIHGIRKDNELICLSISCDTLGNLRFSSASQAIFRLASVSGVFSLLWSLIKELFRQEAKKAPLLDEIHYGAHYLEICMIETLYSYKDQGLEHMMLHYLCEKAKKQGFKGALALPDKGSPFFYACLEEEFKEVPDKEVGFQGRVREKLGTSLCLMLLVF